MNESSNLPNPSLVAKHVIDLMGGHDACREKVDADFDYITVQWEQDTTLIGRILRAHLFVEHFLTAYIQFKNPNLGDLENARLSYSQKIRLIDPKDFGIAYLVPGIVRLNQIRNRLAHTLCSEITEDDIQSFLNIKLYVALRSASGQEFKRENCKTEAVALIEHFARHAGSSLHSVSTGSTEIWAQAFKLAAAENPSKGT